MKTVKLTIILLSILIFSCQKNSKKSEILNTETNSLSTLNDSSEIKIKKEIKKIETDTVSNLNHSSENTIYRNITELKKYNGFEKVSGQVLGNSNKALVYIQKDSLKVLVLEEIIKNSSNEVNYSILDEVHLIFKSESSDQYIIALTECDLIENPDDEMIFSLVENNEDNEVSDKVLKTWIIDLNQGEFKEIKTEKVKCIDIWFGYDG